MNPHFSNQYIPYKSTNRFSKTALDYISKEENLRAFYNHLPNPQGVKKMIEEKKKHPVNRKLLVEQLTKQYKESGNAPLVKKNIDALLDENTFSVCTAHQPNIFTGHLYFIYKIMHAIRMADTFNKDFPEYHFVPVFFVGSEDADLEELNHIVLDGKSYTWETKQKGAVGRMVIDKNFIELISNIEGRILVEPFGNEIISLVKSCFKIGSTIEQATFLFVHALFKDYGLIILLPDNGAYKKEMQKVFEDDLLDHIPAGIVKKTSESLSSHHHAQAFARDINLFYMKEDIRNRIVKIGDNYIVHDTNLQFTKEEIINELNNHPERFSPNVILRGLFQEMIQPDIVFIGGGGELAYWLQLKDLFKHYDVPYPVIFLRNSFLILRSHLKAVLEKLHLPASQLFVEKEIVFRDYVTTQSTNTLTLEKEKADIKTIFGKIKDTANLVDPSLIDHIASLEEKGLKGLRALEKKLLRAEKNKFDAAGRQINKLFTSIHGEGLQERTENFMLFQALWGKDFFDAVYDASKIYDPEFCIISEEK